MKYLKTCALMLFVFCFVAFFMPVAVWAGDIPHPSTYIPTLSELQKQKKKLTYDIDKMKDLWAEVVGFRSPDLVGKIASEIKPGKYTYKDKEKYPGLKELMWPDMYNRFKPGGPPHGGCIPEFEVIPTRQYYYALPICEATKKNMGKAKFGEDGFLIQESWLGGYPFPRPSGTGASKAQQIMYNVEKRYLAWGLNFYILCGNLHGYTKNLRMDFDGKYDVTHIRLAGRVLMPPYGWFDGRAEKRGEFKNFILGFLAPRDIAGASQGALYYLDADKSDQLMIYLPSLRRIRKMSSTDSQDPIMGQDQIYDDNEGWMQKLSATRYPYKFELLDEREFLVPATTVDGSCYISSKGLEFHGLKFERRPIYVVKLIQLDPNYVYSYRIFYIDKENFIFYHNEYYDQKGRLYRSWDGTYGWFPEMGAYAWSGMLLVMRDHIDLHSGVQQPYQLPAFWTRKDVSLRSLVKKGK